MNRYREIKISSALEEMYRVEQFVEELSDEHMLYGSYFGNIMMAVTEAVKNAIMHGNGENRNRLVKINEELTKEGLWVTVTDEGKGFDYQVFSVKDPGPDYNFEKTGLLLINKLCDDVRFFDNGRTIRMLFKINGIDDRIFSRRETFMLEFFKVYQRMNT
jgi:serine/threonine-protein kinase RsbW